MPLTPMFHVHAWGMPYLATMLGLKQVYAGRYNATSILELIRTEGVSFSHGVPTLMQMVLDAAEATKQRLDGWKIMVGGSALHPSLARRLVHAGASPFVGYGMSETGPVLTLARPLRGEPVVSDEGIAALCHAGSPIPLVDLRLRTTDGELIQAERPGTAGEVVVRAPWLTAGYHADPQATQRLWADGFLHTNDVAVFDADGAIRIVDRSKDVIKSGGEWVSSLDLEAHVSQHPDVVECAVIGMRDARWGERPWAFVRTTPSAEEQEAVAGILARLHEKAHAGLLSRFAIPDRIIVVDDIPKTSVGKCDKKALRARAECLAGAIGPAPGTSGH
jgi:fatty-acyl-CoA synthase